MLKSPQNEALRPVDAYIGSRIRLRRTQLGYSQEKLAGLIGLTFQQVQKYERGANRVGGSRLFQLSRVLDVPPGFFFDAMPEEIAATGGEKSNAGIKVEGRASKAGLGLMRSYQKLDPDLQKALCNLVKKMSRLTAARASSEEVGGATQANWGG